MDWGSFVAGAITGYTVGVMLMVAAFIVAKHRDR